MGIAWPQMLGAVFVSGLAFLLITLLGVRAWLAGAISPSLKHSFAVGIGLFLALIGLYQTGIVTSAAAGLPPEALAGPGGLLRAPDVPLKIGDLRDPRVLLAILGFLLIAVLMQRRVRGAILLGIVATAVLRLAPRPRRGAPRARGDSLHRRVEPRAPLPEAGRPRRPAHLASCRCS